MKKKKILHIVESFGSGVFSFLVDLINRTDKEFDIVIAHGIRSETPKNYKEYFHKNVKFIEVKNFTRNISLTKDLKAFFEIRKIIKEVSPDIIHLHSSKAGFLGRFASNGKKYKTLYNPHGFSFLMQNCSHFKRKVYWLIEKIGALRKCTIVGCSKGEYEEALKLTSNSICINNGIDLEKIDKEIKNLPKKEIDFNNLKICTVGRIGYQKNPKLFNKIAESFTNIKFTWIGDGELKDELKSTNIEVTGWIERKDVLKMLNDNDVFILTSLWEGLPISLLEAMYMKKLCIVTDCIGSKDVINNNNGFIIKNNNYKQIIEGLKDDIYIKITNTAKEEVINKYNIIKETNDYRKVYNE